MRDLLKTLMGDADSNHHTAGPITKPEARKQSISVAPYDLNMEMGRRASNVDQTATRLQLPGVPIYPVPDFCRTVVSSVANYIEDVIIGQNTQMIMFIAPTNTQFYVSFQGSFPLPYLPGSVDTPIDPMASPTGFAFLTRGANSIYVGLPIIGSSVSVVGWRQF